MKNDSNLNDEMRDDDEIFESEIADTSDIIFDSEYDDSDLQELIEPDGFVQSNDEVESKVNKVLDEIADLKRGFSSGNGYAYGANQRGDVALYNEINRLRDELSNMQHSQSLRDELDKMKQELRKENSQKEEKLLSEIKNTYGDLSDKKIEKQSEDNGSKCVENADIAELKRSNDVLIDYAKTLGDKFDSGIENIKSSIKGISAVKPCSSFAHDKKRCKGGAKGTYGAEIMRLLLELKLSLCSLSADERDKDSKMLALYDTLVATKSAVYSVKTGIAEKLDNINNLKSTIDGMDGCAYGVVETYNDLVDYVLALPVCADGVEALASDVNESVKVAFGDVRSVVEYVNLVSSIKQNAITTEKLQRVVELKNQLQNGKEERLNALILDEILSEASVGIEGVARADVQRKIERLCYLPYSEFVTCAHIEYDKQYAPVGTVPAFVEGAPVASSCLASDGDLSKIMSDIAHIKAVVDTLTFNDVEVLSETENVEISKLLEEVKTLHTEVDTLSGSGAKVEQPTSSTPEEVNLFLSEIVSLRDEVQSYKDDMTSILEKFGSSPVKNEEDSDSSVIFDELTAIRADLAEFGDELDGLKAIIEGQGKSESAVTENVAVDNTPVLNQLSELRTILENSSSYCDDLKIVAVRDELLDAIGKIGGASDNVQFDDIKITLDEIKEQIIGLQTPADISSEVAQPDDTLLKEIAELRSAIIDGNSTQTSVNLGANVEGLLQKIYDDVRCLRDDPDYSVMNEILALREEFQLLKERMEKSMLDCDNKCDDDINELKTKLEEVRASVSEIDNGAKAEDIEQLKSMVARQAENQNLMLSLMQAMMKKLESQNESAPVDEDALKASTDELRAELSKMAGIDDDK